MTYSDDEEFFDVDDDDFHDASEGVAPCADAHSLPKLLRRPDAVPKMALFAHFLRLLLQVAQTTQARPMRRQQQECQQLCNILPMRMPLLAVFVTYDVHKRLLTCHKC